MFLILNQVDPSLACEGKNDSLEIPDSLTRNVLCVHTLHSACLYDLFDADSLAGVFVQHFLNHIT